MQGAECETQEWHLLLMLPRQEKVNVRVSGDVRRRAKTLSPVPTSRSPVYKNSSSIGKAVERAREALPKSPTKRKAVIRRLAVGNEPTQHEVDTESKYAPEHKVPADVSDAVKKFYEQPDTSWMSPGKKDLVIIKTGKRKDKVQKSFLIMTI